ncbi:PadR family transcriptional regulator [Secundilactobacillus folii]|nr:PadR family transcriptional regulator [Secundilactobacillus folii]
MYDLLVLSALLVHDRTGYKLRKILETSLDPRRQISNGVMYPLLHRLEKSGYIELDTKIVKGHERKIAHITPAGEQYLHTLMKTPVAMDAKRESTFHFKFRALGREKVKFQRSVLQAYQTAIHSDIEVYQEVISHLKKIVERPERKMDVGWSLRTLQLELAVSNAKLAWTRSQLNELKSRSDDSVFIEPPKI